MKTIVTFFISRLQPTTTLHKYYDVIIFEGVSSNTTTRKYDHRQERAHAA